MDFYADINASTLSPNPAQYLIFEKKDNKMRAVVGVSCCLSILGSLLIILSFILFKKRRTRAREILLHISFMDLGVALANLIGLSVYFDKYYFNYYEHDKYSNNSGIPPYIQGLCLTQAFFAAYCTISSILWTIALAGFLYFLILHHKTRIAIYFYRSSHIVCYSLPLLVCLWLVMTQRLGYSPLDSGGWCTLISRDFDTKMVDIYGTVFGNDLWVYLAIVTIPILYMSIRCSVVNQVKEIENYVSPEKFWSSLNHVDYKFLIIPVVFVFLRIWSAIVNILYLYVQVEVSDVNSEINLALIYLSGIGDSSQGFANAIMFVIFTKNIRDSFIRCFCWWRKQEGGDLEVEGQAYSESAYSANLNTVSSDRDKLVTHKETLTGSAEVNENEVSLVFGSLTPSVKSNHSDVFPQRYGGFS